MNNTDWQENNAGLLSQSFLQIKTKVVNRTEHDQYRLAGKHRRSIFREILQNKTKVVKVSSLKERRKEKRIQSTTLVQGGYHHHRQSFNSTLSEKGLWM